MKKLLMTMIATVALSAAAVTPIEIKLWPDGAPNSNGLEGTKEGIQGDLTTSISDPVLYVFPAKDPNGTALMMCPGGAYWGVAMDHEGLKMADWFNSMGITYAVLKYRMPNGHYEVPLTDAERAIRIMREHAKDWGVNPNSIGVGGASAGGHFASTLATHYTSEETRPDFQVLFYPVITMGEVTHGGSRDNLLGKNPTAELIERYSNEKQVNANTPKAFIMVSSDDAAVPVANSLRYYEALVNNGVSASMHIYPIGGHGWGFADWFVYKPSWKAELERWLQNEVIK